MKFGHHTGGVALTLIAALAFLAAGCGQNKDGAVKNKDAQAKAKGDDKHDAKKEAAAASCHTWLRTWPRISHTCSGRT